MTASRLKAGCMAVLALAACTHEEAGNARNGYVEGDYVQIGPEQTGRIARLPVEEGQSVPAAAELFAMEDTEFQARRDEAAARLAQAEAQLADLRKGRRTEEIAVTEARLLEAVARRDNARRELARLRTLERQNVSSESAADRARMAFDAAEAQVLALERELAVARMPARDDAIAAAERNVAAARSALAQAEWRLGQLVRSAPAAGSIDRVFFRAGEVVPAGRPVVSLLPPENKRVLFFVGEPELARIAPGMTVQIACDACPAGLTARVSFVSRDAEFTPPVIFSTGSREKLVYKIEARPLDAALAALKVGQPVDVSLPEGASP